MSVLPLFLKRTADVLPPRLSVVFRRLVHLGSLTACYRQANVTPISKSPPSSSVVNYHLYCPRCLSTWCRFTSDNLWIAVVCFQPTSLLTGKVWVPVMHFCGCHICCKVHWRVGRRLQIDFSTAFDRVNYQRILYELCSVGIGGSVLSILTQFLSNRSQHVIVDGCGSKLVNIVSGVPQGSVLGPSLFLLYTSELFSILENNC